VDIIIAKYLNFIIVEATIVDCSGAITVISGA